MLGQKALAIVDPVAPDDILTKNYRIADPEEIPNGGITLAELRDGQRDGLIGLVRHYVERKTADLAATSGARSSRTGWMASASCGPGRKLGVRGTTTR